MTINLPEKLNDLTLKQWQEIQALPDNSGDEFYMRRVLGFVYDIRGVDIVNIRNSDIELMMNTVKDLLNTKPKFQQRFTLGDVEFGFVPNLDDITFGEFIDLDKYSTPEDYDRLMSILYRPIIGKQSGNRYEVEPYGGSYSFSDIPLGVALGALVFFLTLGEQLMNDIRNSLTEEEVAQLKKQGLLKNGVGTVQFFH